jgi:hypothetical protein
MTNTENQKKMMWIAYDVMGPHIGGREQFNGEKPAWGESEDDFLANQGVDVPVIGDQLSLRMGMRRVYDRRLEQPDHDDNGVRVNDWYWTVLVK